MAKKFNSITTLYNCSGVYVKREKGNITLEQFDIVTDSRNERNIKKAVVDTYENVAMRDVMVQNIVGVKTVHTYKVDASLSEIIAACRAYGLDVIDLGIAIPDVDIENDYEDVTEE